jgi:hypothetical protein
MFRGAVYRLAIQVGRGDAIMTADEVADLLAIQYHNRGKTTAEELRRRWIASPWFVRTEIYPALPEIGVTAGKTGETYSVGQPLVVDEDLRSVAVQNPDGSLPRYLVLDGQNRTVKLRNESPYRRYPAYVGINILDDIERANQALAQRLKWLRRPRRPGLEEML